ncbi:hypothetical protein A0O34_21525 [Chryseobacterium glaciei]|uniref:DUF1016 domain-containing protein n=1 Tax=Chryseobacterium glaciei TaxID=1685010 RepID=A0A172Y103_9FLAO|nr:PDDEXK nuclease domain-containing protein [Chryseobacterium glaciei]ANF52943.1 hypothetical protein A0O34_21525 [Chryseobacterium glaciei]
MSTTNPFPLLENIESIIAKTQQYTGRNGKRAMIAAYFQIGKMIVEDEQQGYAEETILLLSEELSKEFGTSYSMSNLEYMRSFYINYQHRIPRPVIGVLETRFSLSWTHYVQLLKMKNEDERNFYETEAIQNKWSVRELQRQYNCALFERLILSRNRDAVKELAANGQLVDHMLDFFGIKEDNKYSENNGKSVIINNLENFMLELGKGFLFEGRQRRFTFEGGSFVVDLVFYNRLLKCFVLSNVMIGKFTQQDIGQMQMYVNYYDRKIKISDENPTIGIILSKDANRTVVEFILPENNKKIFAKEYKAVLPTKEELTKQFE